MKWLLVIVVVSAGKAEVTPVGTYSTADTCYMVGNEIGEIVAKAEESEAHPLCTVAPDEAQEWPYGGKDG